MRKLFKSWLFTVTRWSWYKFTAEGREAAIYERKALSPETMKKAQGAFKSRIAYKNKHNIVSISHGVVADAESLAAVSPPEELK